MDFLIINSPSVYNMVLGRPAMNDLDMVTSTRTLTVTFLTTKGIGCVRGKQQLARRCYKDAVRMGTKRKKVNVVLGGKPRVVTEKGVNSDLDPREVDTDRATSLIEELEDAQVNKADPERCL